MQYTAVLVLLSFQESVINRWILLCAARFAKSLFLQSRNVKNVNVVDFGQEFFQARIKFR